MRRTPHQLLWFAAMAVAGALACASPSTPAAPVARSTFIPSQAVKAEPADDFWPPVTAAGWSAPEPMPGPINTAGAEDSPYPTHDGRTFLFVFTPDVTIPVEKQLRDGVTGIWSAQSIEGTWSEPERVWLADRDEPALDGCPFALGDTLYFCSVRVGNVREIDIYQAALREGTGSNWKNAGRELNVDLEIGEMHMNASGTEIIFASRRAGGFGGLDLWSSRATAEGWGAPVNIGAVVNSASDENRPALSPDETELWFDGPSRRGAPGPSVYRAVRQPDGTWGPAEEIVSSFAGEPAFSADGQILYFVHHYYSADLSRMIEADIYMSRRLAQPASP